jgi:HD-GYP domain-containing protein (c-di-GMP phosphodiesterase class II)
MSARERAVAGAMALTLVLAAVGIAEHVPGNRTTSFPLLAVLVLVAAIARRVRFEIGNGEACADQLGFIPILFLAPLHLVPLLVALAYVLAPVPDLVRGRVHPDRWLYFLGDAWHSIGAVVVIAALAPGPLAFDHLPVYALALIAQVAVGLLVTVPTDRLIHRTTMLEVLSRSTPAFRVYAMLTPIAYVVAATAEKEPLAIVGAVPLLWLLAVFSRERREHFLAAVELNQAYRGTVMMLSDVVEADHESTATHSRSVVQLAQAVAMELRMDPRARPDLEMAALLHDVGKVAIPNTILNKPAKLTDEEFELIKTHTIEGQALLDRVGGTLGRVGRIVRSCHERWDGTGYPDGLKTHEIPEAARIVFCCDAYSAMTSDRPYQAAMSIDDALAELRANSGTQFEPRVVVAMEWVARSTQAVSDLAYPDAVRAVLQGVSPPVEVEIVA